MKRDYRLFVEEIHLGPPPYSLSQISDESGFLEREILSR